MKKSEIIKRLENIADHAVHMVGEEPFVMSIDDGIAVNKAIKALEHPELEIIHCKDCEYYDNRPCGIVDWYNGADDFCSRAKRRTDD